MPHVKWCQFSGIPSMNPRFINLLNEIRMERPKYAFFVDFNYEAQWDQILRLLSELNIDKKHAYFAIHSINTCSSGINDIFNGIVTRGSSLSDDQIRNVTESVADYFTFAKDKLGHVFPTGDTSIHSFVETDDLLAIHVNTIIKSAAGEYFVDAAQMDELLRDNYTKDKAVVAFGCGDPAHFVDKKLFAAICSMYKANIYMCSSTSSQIDKIVNNENVWRVGVSRGANSFNLCCIDTDLNYTYVKRYSMREDYSWSIDHEIEAYENQKRTIDHYGKKYLLSNDLEINQLHSLALKELENGLDTFLASDKEIQEWVVLTHQYHPSLDFTLEFYIDELIKKKYETWDFKRFEYLDCDPEEYVKRFASKNVLLTCHIKNLNKCRSWVDQIAWTIIKYRALKIRIIIIGNDASIELKDTNNTACIPFDIYHELQLPEMPTSTEKNQRKQLSMTPNSENTQLILGIFWEYMGLRKKWSSEKNQLKYTMTINLLYKFFEELTMNDQRYLLQMLEGKEEKHDNNKENELVSSRAERDNSHDQ